MCCDNPVLSFLRVRIAQHHTKAHKLGSHLGFHFHLLRGTRQEVSTKPSLPDNGCLYPNCDVDVWLRSCIQEIESPIEGTITGEIPDWLEGSLIRNGPGSLKVGDMSFLHLFDSSALLHRFFISSSRVTYQCRFLQSETYKRNTAAQRIVVTEFGTAAVPDPCQTIFHRVSALFEPGRLNSDNAMISVYPFGDEMYAFTESPVIHRFNSDTLETEERVDLSEYVNIVNHTSHPHVMPDGTVYNLGLSITKSGPKYNIVRFPPSQDKTGTSMFEKAIVVATIPARWPLHPSYMHTFGLTDNYFIIIEQPLSVSLTGILKAQLSNQPFASCFRWYDDEQTCIYLVSRADGVVKHTFFSKPFFYLHVINQYEMSDHVVLDICSYRDPSMLQCMYVETMKNMHQNPDYARMFRGRPLRFVLPLHFIADQDNLVHLAGTDASAHMMPDGRVVVEPEQLCNLGCETPRINYEGYLGKAYRYFYAISSDVDAENPGTIIKVDTLNKTRLTWCEDNCYPSEPIFIPNPHPKSEDDGVVISAMVWGRQDTDRVGLLVLNAKTWCELGRAEFDTPGPVPKCLHGWFLNNNRRENI